VPEVKDFNTFYYLAWMETGLVQAQGSKFGTLEEAEARFSQLEKMNAVRLYDSGGFHIKSAGPKKYKHWDKLDE
jgi:hypothetical protein